jgi:hypothetical protein
MKAHNNVKTYPEPLDSIFSLSPDGKVYEIPVQLAEQLQVQPERMKELGHLPFFPHSDAPVEVTGRHFVVGPDGRFGPHTDVLYGTALDSDGRYYTGWHHHPNGTELAVFEHREESPMV